MPNHYLYQWWPSSIKHICITRLQWVIYKYIFGILHSKHLTQCLLLFCLGMKLTRQALRNLPPNSCTTITAMRSSAKWWSENLPPTSPLRYRLRMDRQSRPHSDRVHNIGSFPEILRQTDKRKKIYIFWLWGGTSVWISKLNPKLYLFLVKTDNENRHI